MNVFDFVVVGAKKALLSRRGLNLSNKGSGETTIPFNSVKHYWDRSCGDDLVLLCCIAGRS
jgi:hypothetical protein